MSNNGEVKYFAARAPSVHRGHLTDAQIVGVCSIGIAVLLLGVIVVLSGFWAHVSAKFAACASACRHRRRRSSPRDTLPLPSTATTTTTTASTTASWKAKVYRNLTKSRSRSKSTAAPPLAANNNNNNNIENQTDDIIAHPAPVAMRSTPIGISSPVVVVGPGAGPALTGVGLAL